MGIILFELLYPFSTQMERMRALTNVRLRIPVFPNDFEQGGTNRNKQVCCLIHWLLSYSARDRPRAIELRQATLYQHTLQVEVPNMFIPNGRQPLLTIANSQDLISSRNRQRDRISSSSPLRRTVSSSAFHPHRDSDSENLDCTNSSSISSSSPPRNRQ